MPTPGKMKAYPTFDAYLADQSARNQDVIRVLRTLVKRVAPRLQESVKWGHGCWILDAVPVAYAYSAPDHVQFGFFRGATLNDPEQLLRGKGQFVRHIKVSTRADIDERMFAALLRQAVRAATPLRRTPAAPRARAPKR